MATKCTPTPHDCGPCPRAAKGMVGLAAADTGVLAEPIPPRRQATGRIQTLGAVTAEARGRRSCHVRLPHQPPARPPPDPSGSEGGPPRSSGSLKSPGKPARTSDRPGSLTGGLGGCPAVAGAAAPIVLAPTATCRTVVAEATTWTVPLYGGHCLSPEGGWWHQTGCQNPQAQQQGGPGTIRASENVCCGETRVTAGKLGRTAQSPKVWEWPGAHRLPDALSPSHTGSDPSHQPGGHNNRFGLKDIGHGHASRAS